MLARNAHRKASRVFAGKIVCTECGDRYGRKVWHSTDPKKRKEVWQCNSKFATRHQKSFLNPKDIEEAFLKAARQFIAKSQHLIPSIKEEYEKGFGVKKEKARLLELEKKVNAVEDQIDHARDVAEVEELEVAYGNLLQELEEVKWRKCQMRDRLRKYGKILKVLENGITEFDEASFNSLVDKIISGPKGMKFIFFDGTEIMIAA